MKSEDLLKNISYLELVSKKNAISCLNGAYITGIRGKGTEFLEARKYVQGESIRSIDWNMTARMGEPYVKVFHEEREREVYIALDISSSMFVRFQEKNKYDVGLEIAAGIAYSAIQADDRLGYLFFKDTVVEESNAVSGKKQFFRFLKSALQYRDSSQSFGKTDIRSIVHSIQQKKGNRFVVFIISDFIDLDIPDDMRYMVKEHDISLFHIYDIFEYPPEDLSLKILFSNPEDPNHCLVSSPGEYRSLAEQESYLKELCSKLGFSLGSFPTHQPYEKNLASFFNKKKIGTK